MMEKRVARMRDGQWTSCVSPPGTSGNTVVTLSLFYTATCSWVYALSKNAKDMNGDGLVDMLGYCNPNGGNTPPTLWIFRGRGDGSFERKFDLTNKPIWPLSLLTANDFDGDGDHDILGGLDDDGNPGAASMLLNLGAAAGNLWTAAYQILDVTPTNTSGSDAPGVGSGTSFDYTGDGYPDLLLSWAPDIAGCGYAWSCTTSDLALLPNTTANPCGEGRTCNASNQCVACTPSCGGRTCGGDGCGGSCGECRTGEVCSGAGQCVQRNACVPTCGTRTCGDDGCGGQCGTCPGGQGCVNGQCQACTPSCAGKVCGGDGCGGSCAFFGAPLPIARDTNSRYGESPTNAPPTAPGVTILPANPGDNDDLTCAVTTPSYDLDRVTLEYRWFRSGAYAKDVGDKARVSRTLTGSGQVWECRVRATDGVEWSPPASATVTIN